MHLLTSDATVSQRVGLWYRKMGVVSKAPSQKSRGIKEFYPSFYRKIAINPLFAKYYNSTKSRAFKLEFKI
jgi:hypothetical protein